MKARPKPKRLPAPAQPNRPRHRARIALGLASIVGVSAFAYWFNDYLHRSPRFQVRAIEIDGIHFLDDDTVLKSAGITSRDNVFNFDMKSAEAEVEKLPYVKSASVSVTFPDTVVFAIEEREPFASLLIHSRAYEIDGDGVVLREYGLGEVPRTPFVTAPSNLRFVGEGKEIDNVAVSNAIRVWKACIATGLDREMTISELAAFGEDDVRMFCEESPYEIRWGRGDYERQALRLAAFWRKVGVAWPCKEYLDLRFGKNLACK